MDLSVDKALRITNKQFPVHFVEQFENQIFNGREIRFIMPVELTGVYEYDGKRIVVDGEITTLLDSVCARCNEHFSESVKIHFHEFFYNEAVAQETDIEDQEYYFNGLTVELDNAVINNLFLELPLNSICRDDCKGLCSICGVNLNNMTCDCSKDRKSSVFAELLKNQIFNNE